VCDDIDPGAEAPFLKKVNGGGLRLPIVYTLTRLPESRSMRIFNFQFLLNIMYNTGVSRVLCLVPLFHS